MPISNSVCVKTILILAAIPNGLRLDKEIRSIEECIRRAVRRDLYQVIPKTAVRPQDIRRAIAETKPQIVHFCGHGLEDGSLLLEDDGGQDSPVSPQGLAALFELHKDSVDCVLLNACHSVKSAEAISKYINYAIGMNQEIQDNSAIQFSQGFYDGLGYETSNNLDRFRRAFREGLVALKMENLSSAETPVMKTKINASQTVIFGNPPQGAGIPFQAPPLPTYYVDCPEYTQDLKNRQRDPARPNNQPFARPEPLKTYLKWLLLFVIGVGLAITLHFVIIRQWAEAFTFLSLTVILTLLILAGIFLVEFLNRLYQNWESGQQQLAVRLADAIWSEIEVLVWEFTSPFKHQYYQSLIYSCRDYRTQGLKIKGPFTLDLEKMFVPLKVAPESAERISQAMIQYNEKESSQSIWDFLVSSCTHVVYRSIAIIGPPGSGKTTLLEHLALSYAKNTQRQQHQKAPQLIPILLYLRDVRNTFTNQTSLSELIEGQESISKLNPPPKWFERQLSRQPCLVMLDGLDEVAESTQRQSISCWVNQQIQKYPNARFVLTSRPFGYQSAPVEEVRTILEVQPFNLEQVQTFVQNWYLQNEIMSRLGKNDQGVRQSSQTQSNDLIERIKNSPPLAAMALNPLLLTMIATVHRYRGALPGRRVELYAEICDVLLGRRLEDKGIPGTLTAEQNKAVLQSLALGLMERNTREFTPNLGYSLIQGELTKVVGNSLTPKEFIENIKSISGLLVEREKDLYEFAHKSFQEYLAAAQIKETNQECIITTKINDDWWHETICLYAAQGNATNIIRAALDNPTVASLQLALDCQSEGLRVEQQVREQLAEKLEHGLESSEPEIAKLAAQVKLVRRLSKLLRIDENLEIDTIGITCAEYQLFIDEQLKTGEKLVSRNAKKAITGISFQEAKRFCVWLNFKAPLHKSSDSVPYFYRLVTETEARRYSVIEAEGLLYWSGSNSDKVSRIWIVKEKILSQYIQLFSDLAVGKWKKADLETASIMKIANRVSEDWLDVESLKKFPSQELCTIDWLWVTYSGARFGFSVQKRIWEGIRKQQKNDEVNYDTYKTFGERLGWCVEGNWLTYNDLTFSLNAPEGHLPYPNKTYSKQIWRSKAWRSFIILLERAQDGF